MDFMKVVEKPLTSHELKGDVKLEGQAEIPTLEEESLDGGLNMIIGAKMDEGIFSASSHTQVDAKTPPKSKKSSSQEKEENES